MFFWVSFAFLGVPPLIWALSLINWTVSAKRGRSLDVDAVAFTFFMPLFLFLGAVPAISTWNAHASDISKIEAQHHRIEVYTERIESLERRLSDFDYPDKPTISVDADTPWASMVKSLNDAESELARAKDERAIAIRSIRARMRGPMSGVVGFVGLPEGWSQS